MATKYGQIIRKEKEMLSRIAWENNDVFFPDRFRMVFLDKFSEFDNSSKFVLII